MKLIKRYMLGVLAACLCLGAGIYIGVTMEGRKQSHETVKVCDSSKPSEQESVQPEKVEASQSPAGQTQEDANGVYWVTKEQLKAEQAAQQMNSDESGQDSAQYSEQLKKQFLSDPDSFLLEGSSQWKLDFSEIALMDEEMLDLAKNEIYARHGYPFTKDSYQKIFNQKSWYKLGTKNVTLSEIEKSNIAALTWYSSLKKKGEDKVSRYPDTGSRNFCDGWRFKAGEVLSIDMDNDGQAEEVTVKKISDEEMILCIDGQTTKIEGAFLNDEIWIVDIDPSDNYKELIVFDEGPSSDPVDTYFYYGDHEIRKMGEVGGHLNALDSGEDRNYIENGTLHSVWRSDLLDTHRYEVAYKLDDKHQLIEQPTALYEVHIPIFFIKDVTVYLDQDLKSSKTMLAADTGVTAVATDGLNWIQLEDGAGKKVWLYTEEGYISDSCIGLEQFD